MSPKRVAPGAAGRTPPRAGQSHQVRIIGGSLKRRRIAVLDRPGLRPTPDRVRETLFNWLGQDLTGWSCIDAFAGTGALGLEAASRGAGCVTLIEADTQLCRHLRQTVQRLELTEVQVVHADCLAYMRSTDAAQQDIVFLDPPFDGNQFESALQAAYRLVKPNAWIYLEAPRQWPDAELAELGLLLYRHLKAGQVHAHLLRPIAKATNTRGGSRA